MSSQIGTPESKWKRRKIGDAAKPPPSRWRTQAEQQIYSSRLLDALRQVRRNSTPSVPPRSRAVREAADRVLAAAARGRNRWSRAILLSGRKTLKLKAARRRPRKPPAPAKMGLLPAAAKKKSEAVQRKAKVLGRLVPGCGKLPLPALLDETSDYIAALEMQVRAMAALAEMLSSVAVVGSGTPARPPPGPPPAS